MLDYENMYVFGKIASPTNLQLKPLAIKKMSSLLFQLYSIHYITNTI